MGAGHFPLTDVNQLAAATSPQKIKPNFISVYPTFMAPATLTHLMKSFRVEILHSINFYFILRFLGENGYIWKIN